MKLILHTHQKWYKKRAQQEARKKQNAGNKRRKKNHSYQMPVYTITMPKVIYINDKEEHRTPLMESLEKLEANILQRKKVSLSFAQTTDASADGMILVLATIHNLTNAHPKNLIRIKRSNFCTPKIKEVLCQIKLFEHLGQKPPITHTKHQDVIDWVQISGTNIDPSNNARLFDDKRIEGLKNDKLFPALTEALSNSVEHAYKGQDIDPSHEKWWAFRQIKDNYLTIVVCDLGIGIPESLKIKNEPWFKKIFHGIPNNAKIDAKAIEQAVQHSRSRHEDNMPERGKGLPQILDAINEYNNQGYEAVIQISSNYGLLRKRKSKETNNEPPITHNFKNSIKGTIISWRIPLKLEDY